MEKSKLYSILSKRSSIGAKDNDISLACSVKLYRNIDQYPFPGKLSEEKRTQLMKVLENALLNAESLNKPYLFNAENLEPLEKEYLFEHFLASDSFHQAHHGEGFVIDESAEFLAVINVRDHLQLQVNNFEGDIEKAWNRLVKIECDLDKPLNFSYSENFGFLAADIKHSGTGLNVSSYLHVPALITLGCFNDVYDDLKTEGINLSGMQGSIDDLDGAVGNIICLRNGFCLGLSEEDIIKGLRSLTTKLIVAEKACRIKLKNSEDIHVRDKVNRAYGLLTCSYQLETVESLNALSLCLLGSELGWITGVKRDIYKELLVKTRRAHLMQIQANERDFKDLPHIRSEIIREKLKKAALASS
jgi:protein arginine kinase